MSKFEIVSGDIPTGARYDCTFGVVTISHFDYDQQKTVVHQIFDNIASLQQVTEETKTSFAGQLGWGTLGALTFGTVGALAGLLFGGGKSKEICFACEFKTGEKFLAICDPKTYQRFYSEYMQK